MKRRKCFGQEFNAGGLLLEAGQLAVDDLDVEADRPGVQVCSTFSWVELFEQGEQGARVGERLLHLLGLTQITVGQCQTQRAQGLAELNLLDQLMSLGRELRRRVQGHCRFQGRACLVDMAGPVGGGRAPHLSTDSGPDDLAAATQRIALLRPYLRRQLARTGWNVIRHPSPPYLSVEAWLEGCWRVIAHLPAPITDCSATAQGHLKQGTPAAYVVQSPPSSGNIIGHQRAPFAFSRCAIISS